MKITLAYLLFLANTNPGAAREVFYAMKAVLLRRYGERVGEDVQEIIHECWDCHGEGGWMEDEWIECYRCGGDGVWERQWVALDRWQLGGRTFHNPRARLHRRPEQVTIRGRVRHANMGRWATVAKWMLFCWFCPAFVKTEACICVHNRIQRWKGRYCSWKADVRRWRERSSDEIPF